MFGWLKKKPVSERIEIRDTLFGDMSLAQWAGPTTEGKKMPPWTSFIEAKNYLDSGNKLKASEVLQRIADTGGLESRHYVQAWHFLRQLGVNPPEAKAKELYGVVVEVTLDQGLDIVAAYADYHARYYNYSGAGVVWERPDASLDSSIDALLNAGRTVVIQIGPWDGTRPPAPPKGQVRLSMLTPSGLHFGQGAFDVLAGDPMGGPLIAAATNLMQALIKKSEEANRKV